jgi:hypothetical protein
MTIKEILGLEPEQLMKMNRKELATVTSLLSRGANKRMQRLEAKELDTPALQGLERSGGRFSTRGKNLNELRSEFYRVSHFLNARTSTITGAKKVHKEVEERIGGALTPSQMKDFWGTYRKLKEMEPASLQDYGSDQVQQFLRKEFVESGFDSDTTIESAQEELNQAYEEREEETYDMGEFFEI